MTNEPSVWDWARELKTFETAKIDQLPDLDLYMDQVITLLTKELALFEVGEEKLLTSNMINNYVKGELLPRPERKKYNREHLLYLLMICRLKSVLSLPQISDIMQALAQEKSMEEVYTGFRDAEQQLTVMVSEKVLELEDAADHDKRTAAMELAILANLCRCASTRLLESLQPEDLVLKAETTKKEKNKDKSKERKKAKEKTLPKQDDDPFDAFA